MAQTSHCCNGHKRVAASGRLQRADLIRQHPEQLQTLRSDPSRIPNAIEEVLRVEAPARGMIRTATAEVELGGATIPQGAQLMVLWASGNRDEVQFAEADRFDMARTNASQHLSFGKGIHYCLGAPLARVEGRIALELLLARLPNLRMAPDTTLERWPNLFGRGYLRLPMEWKA
jgi:cytochrome P450